MTKENGNEEPAKDWMACGATFYCRVDLGSGDYAVMGVAGINQAHERYELLETLLHSCFGLNSVEQLTFKRTLMNLKTMNSWPDEARREWLSAIENLLSVSHLSWNLSAWAEANGRKPPEAPRFVVDDGACEVQVLDEIPLEYIARLLWALKWLCSRAREGKWDSFARLPSVYWEEELPPDLRDELSEIDADSTGDEDGG